MGGKEKNGCVGRFRWNRWTHNGPDILGYNPSRLRQRRPGPRSNKKYIKVQHKYYFTKVSKKTQKRVSRAHKRNSECTCKAELIVKRRIKRIAVFFLCSFLDMA